MGVLKLAGADFRRTLKDPKIIIIIAIAFFFFYDSFGVMKDLAEQADLGVTPYAYTIYLSEWRGRMYAILLMVMIMADAPFYNGSETNISLRVSRFKWFAGKMIYIFGISVLFQISMVILSIIVFIPYISMSDIWGDVIYTYMMNMQGMISSGGIIESNSILELNPIYALIYEVVLMILLSVIIGLLIFIINGLCKNSLGTIIVGIVAIADPYITDLSFYSESASKWRYKMPTSWIDLNCFYKGENLSFEKCFLYMLAVILLLVIIGSFLVCKRWINPIKNS